MIMDGYIYIYMLEVNSQTKYAFYIFIETSQIVSSIRIYKNVPIPTIRIGLSTQTDRDSQVDRRYSHKVLGSNFSLSSRKPSLNIKFYHKISLLFKGIVKQFCKLKTCIDIHFLNTFSYTYRRKVPN